jgi:hypothetical protein
VIYAVSPFNLVSQSLFISNLRQEVEIHLFEDGGSTWSFSMEVLHFLFKEGMKYI